MIVAILIAALITDGADDRIITGGAWLLLMSAALVGRIWLAWLPLTLVTAGNLLITIFEKTWLGVLFNTVMLTLLVAPPTRRYAQRWRLRPIAWVRKRRSRGERDDRVRPT